MLDASIAIEAGMKWQSRCRLAWRVRDGLPMRIVDAVLVLGTEQRVLGEVDDRQGCKVYRWILRLMLG